MRKLQVLATLIALVLLANNAIAGGEEDSVKTPLEIIAIVGNESNPADGVLGPVTYGGELSYEFRDAVSAGLTYVRMHEPETPAFTSVLDEAQLSLNVADLLHSGLEVSPTLWRNRMVDIYTDLAGLDLSIGDEIRYGLGLYAGKIEQEAESAPVVAGQIGFSTEIHDVELSVRHFAGLIHAGKGTIHRTEVEAGIPLHSAITLTLEGARRYFNFSLGGPKIDPIDTYIFVAGVEIDLTELLHL